MAVGGTFDEFHKGHRVLLLKAFEVGEHVQIGLSSDDFVRRMNKPHKTASYDERLRDLKAFLSARGLLDRTEIIPLYDAYGTTLCRGCLDALVVSRETQPIAVRINDKRREDGLSPIEVVVIDMIPSENHVVISTTRIRQGEIDREGRVLKT